MLLHQNLEKYAETTPDHLFSEFKNTKRTYKEANITANQIANSFIKEGLKKGDRFTFLAKNCDEMAIMYHAASKVGVVPVPLNYRLANQEWEYIINDSQSKLIMVRDDEFISRVDSFRDKLHSVKKYISICSSNKLSDWIDLNNWTEDTGIENLNHDIAEDDDVYQMYTSGTTGLPKGAIILQRNVAANTEQYFDRLVLPIPPRTLLVAPMYHAAAMINFCGCIAVGGTVVIHEDFIPSDVVQTLSKEKISHTVLVPAMIQACLMTVRTFDDCTFDQLDQIHYGASPIAPETLKRAMDVFGCKFGQGFGMTEAGAVICILSTDDHERALKEKPELLKSCGKPVKGATVEIRDEDGNELPRGEIGQICAKGPQIMKGYWNKEEETKKSLVDGWMHTGDAGRMDNEGYVYIQDRIKDMIVSGGENIYSTEVEAVLFSHPEVVDAAVIGVPDDKLGEVVKACVVIKEGSSLTDIELIDFCKEKIASYKKPRSVDFISEVPRNASGKVLKKTLREPYWKGRDRQVS